MLSFFMFSNKFLLSLTAITLGSAEHSLYKKSFWEAQRAKPLISWQKLYLRKTLKKLRFNMFYILLIEREIQTTLIPF